METSPVTCRTLETFYHINGHLFEKYCCPVKLKIAQNLSPNSFIIKDSDFFVIRASPLMKKYRFWWCFLCFSFKHVIPCFVWILQKRDKVDVVHECEANHCYHL